MNVSELDTDASTANATLNIRNAGAAVSPPHLAAPDLPVYVNHYIAFHRSALIILRTGHYYVDIKTKQRRKKNKQK